MAVPWSKAESLCPLCLRRLPADQDDVDDAPDACWGYGSKSCLTPTELYELVAGLRGDVEVAAWLNALLINRITRTTATAWRVAELLQRAGGAATDPKAGEVLKALGTRLSAVL